MPRETPINKAINEETKPTTMEFRVPQMTRLNISRPIMSVPSGCFQLPPWLAQTGGIRRFVKLMASGLWGEIQGPNMAQSTKTDTMRDPNFPKKLFFHFLYNTRIRHQIISSL